jgi:FKBP-type peptidyl-prolyl cis-trans isomerase SlyD
MMLAVQNNHVVGIDYVLKDENGEVIDQSSPSTGLLRYIQGCGQILPKLEQAILGKKVGDHVDITISAADGYGEFDETKCIKVEREHFEHIEDLETGHVINMEMGEDTASFFVDAIEEEHVLLDGNHPLAGRDLYFSVDVREVREATAEELDHGHVHDEHSHH